MSHADHAERMAQTYSTGDFCRVVAAGGDIGFMNLGYAPNPRRPGSTVSRQRNVAGMVFEAVSPAAGQALLDVGCGRGGMVNLIGRLVPDARIIGVNIDRNQLVTAQAHRAGAATFVAAAAERLPFADSAFDTVYAVEILSHVSDKTTFADEFVRVLRPGGRAVLAFIALTRPYPSFARKEREHLRRVADLFAELPDDIPTLASARAAFEEAGLRVIACRDLSDGVFTPRHNMFVRMLRWLRHANPLARAGFAAVVAWRWTLRPQELVDFLAINTASHPGRFYEYHLMTLTKDTERLATA